MKNEIYNFYYKKEERDDNILAGVRQCKKPTRTKLWKQLTLMLDQGTIFSCKWEIDEEEIMERMRHATTKIIINEII
jgi:hypothetical protein